MVGRESQKIGRVPGKMVRGSKETKVQNDTQWLDFASSVFLIGVTMAWTFRSQIPKAATLPTELCLSIQSAIAAKPSPLLANSPSPRSSLSASTTATRRDVAVQSMPKNISNCAVAFLRSGKDRPRRSPNPGLAVKGAGPHQDVAAAAGHRRIRRGLEPSLRPAALRAPVLGEGLQLPRFG